MPWSQGGGSRQGQGLSCGCVAQSEATPVSTQGGCPRAQPRNCLTDSPRSNLGRCLLDSARPGANVHKQREAWFPLSEKSSARAVLVRVSAPSVLASVAWLGAGKQGELSAPGLPVRLARAFSLQQLGDWNLEALFMENVPLLPASPIPSFHQEHKFWSFCFTIVLIYKQVAKVMFLFHKELEIKQNRGPAFCRHSTSEKKCPIPSHVKEGVTEFSPSACCGATG